MYKRRLHIFIVLSILVTSAGVARLAFLQIAAKRQAREEIRLSRILAPIQLPTVRGSILDRNGRILAVDRPAFHVQVNYQLTRLLDERFWQANILKDIAGGDKTIEQAETDLREYYAEDISRLMQIMERCAQMADTPISDIEQRIRDINDEVWALREFFAWRRKFPESELKDKYAAKGRYVPRWAALEDFREKVPDRGERLKLALKEDLLEMHKDYALVDLASEEDLLDAQLEFADIEEVSIDPETNREYPYGKTASQIIGWVAPPQENDKELFEEDKYSRYLPDDTAGRGNGVEKVCEVILRGRRGEKQYDMDGRLIGEKETIFGKDVQLSLDIELQQEVEGLLKSNSLDPNVTTGMGAVVLDVATGDVLVMASVPGYDPANVRAEYGKLLQAPGKPMLNKCLQEHYPPGSTMKPFILLAGLQHGLVMPDEPISCPPRPAPKGWPNCLILRKYGLCHDTRWTNNARNAIKGSCNVYFSKLADRFEADDLQEWLYSFGFGRKLLDGPEFGERLDELRRQKGTNRNLRQTAGSISSAMGPFPGDDLEDLPPIRNYEKRMFGIGQGSVRATVLQVANGMAMIARHGIFKKPRLFLSESDPMNSYQRDLGIEPAKIDAVREGMYAVVNETGGTARKAFVDSSLLENQSLKIFGKTGSTEKPYNAWFAGFAEDDYGRAISFAIIVEGGTSGAGDAAPIGEQIIQLCNSLGYIGEKKASPLDHLLAGP
ncbi:Penicillin-binding protein A [Anaerohalosphaera lusitana]|uniref:beta-lactamase n=1 Tax=Anaerohalosphaera lusitana TaxID=1936003 RepID=A0A1U9NRG3_9BACT|nr:penicillin-binding transpeptidase domain-containing protein [Anaerohalosphaera lusitana]AQT70116.1 Penicillin-binding protein A [Anaerohalosphaera lusitana]